VSSLAALFRATRADAAVLALTFGVTVVVNLVAAVVVGVGVAIILALRAVSRAAQLEQMPLDSDDHSAEEHALLAQHIVAYRLDGPLFFAAAHRFLLELAEVADVKVVILRLSRLSAIDATGAHVLGDAISRLEHRGIIVLLSGIQPRHDEVLETLGVADHLRADGRIFADTPAAIAHARSLLDLAPDIA
jgi:SulP family sulfate permease